VSKDELIKKYGDVELTFTHYYKHTFFYKGKCEDGGTVHFDYTGDGNIYRDEIYSGEKETLDVLVGMSDDTPYYRTKEGELVWPE